MICHTLKFGELKYYTASHLSISKVWRNMNVATKNIILMISRFFTTGVMLAKGDCLYALIDLV